VSNGATTVLHLTATDLVMASVLVLLLAGVSLWMQLGLAQQLVVAAIRTTVQLLLIGFVLKALFSFSHWYWVALLATAMLMIAGREVIARQKHRLMGWWGFGVGTASMFLSTFLITLLVLVLIIGNEPWYKPQYAIPLLGMMLGNTMTGIALGMNTLTQTTLQQRAILESRLMLGHSWRRAMEPILKEATRTGMIPIINAMAAAGVVSLPGMMTGQILAGNPPLIAVQYQILIMFMVTAGTGFGTVLSVRLTARRLFDERERLRVERLSSQKR
jgi:putative ABC transport system permease protein